MAVMSRGTARVIDAFLDRIPGQWSAMSGTATMVSTTLAKNRRPKPASRSSGGSRGSERPTCSHRHLFVSSIGAVAQPTRLGRAILSVVSVLRSPRGILALVSARVVKRPELAAGTRNILGGGLGSENPSRHYSTGDSRH